MIKDIPFIIEGNITNGNQLSYEQFSTRLYDIPLENEFIILLKPECFKLSSEVDIPKDFLDFLDQSFSDFGVKVHGIKVFNSTYAKENSLIESEYFVLNKGARYGYQYLTSAQKRKVNRKYSDCTIIGAYNFLDLNKNKIDSKELEIFTEKHPSDKIGNGIYILPLLWEGSKYAIINAFHPEQINHFYRDNIIVAIACTSKTNYKKLAEDLIGHYIPSQAKEGTIRSFLYKHNDDFNIKIDNLCNGVHISPSPIEGIIGFSRYFSSFTDNIENTLLGQELIGLGYVADEISSFIHNPALNYEGKIRDLFGLCEAKNAVDIVSIMKHLKNKSYQLKGTI